MKTILITGATGQIGTELVLALRLKYGNDNVIAMGYKSEPSTELKNSGPFEIGDVRDKESITTLVKKYNINIIYHLAGILSATGEKNPDDAWEINITSLKNVLDIAKDNNINQVFWPSSIAAFGPGSPRVDTPQSTVMDPSTMYGVTKYSGELLCNYYVQKYGLDIRGLRYPGLISHAALPGGGTTDYAVAIFYEAIKNKKYTSFVREDTILPMMYMEDAIIGTIQLMEADQKDLKTRFSYNFSALSFTVKELSDEIKKSIPEFICDYKPDERQKIADSWPQTIDDSQARSDWGWQHKYDLSRMTEVMLTEIRKKLG